MTGYYVIAEPISDQKVHVVKLMLISKIIFVRVIGSVVRIVVPCAQTRVAIEMHSRVNGAKRCVFREA